MEWFIWLLFGHLFGDYLLQNSWMAENKKSSINACTIHCIIYTLVVCIFLSLGGIEMYPLLCLLIFLSHVVLDGTNIVGYWMKLYGSRSWDSNLPKSQGDYEGFLWGNNMNAKEIVRTVFGSFVYIVIDNTLHLFMMFLIVKFWGLG